MLRQSRKMIIARSDAPRSVQGRTARTFSENSRAADEQFNRFALELFSLQFHHNPAYQTLCKARETEPGNLADWCEIPAVPTSAFKELEFSCLPPDERTSVFHSSGTTEHRPSRHFHSRESLAVYEDSLWPWIHAHVFGAEENTSRNFSLVLLTPPPSQSPHSSLVHMFEVVRERLGAPHSAFVGSAEGDGSWSVDFAATSAQLRKAIDEKTPVALLGTAFSFVHLLDQLAEENVRLELPPESRVMETGGYKGRSRSLPKAELHTLITARLGVPATRIVCEYGMSELSSQAYDLRLVEPDFVRHDLRRFQFPPWARALVISPETGMEVAEGETGLLRVYDLANVYSVMAIQTEDLAVRRGDGFELLGRAANVERRGCSLMVS